MGVFPSLCKRCLVKKVIYEYIYFNLASAFRVLSQTLCSSMDMSEMPPGLLIVTELCWMLGIVALCRGCTQDHPGNTKFVPAVWGLYGLV